MLVGIDTAVAKETRLVGTRVWGRDNCVVVRRAVLGFVCSLDSASSQYFSKVSESSVEFLLQCLPTCELTKLAELVAIIVSRGYSLTCS